MTTNSLAAVQKRLQDAYPNDWKNDLAAAWLAASYQLLKQDKEAAALIAGPQALLERKRASDGGYVTGYYLDPLTRDASVLYLIAKHFPSACASCRRARWTTSPRRSSTTATTRCRRR